jgi:type IV pilus assembly protein PilC
MVKAGLPILSTLANLRDQTEHPAMKEIIEDIRKSLEGGVTLSKCFSKYPKTFDNIYVNLIKAGEASGKLDLFLMKLVESLEKKEAIKKKIKGALMYPAVMFIVAMSVMVFMLTNVVPVFAEMYAGMGVALPTPTAVILQASDFMRGSGGKMVFLTLVVSFGIFKYTTTKIAKIKYIWHQRVLKLPIFGPMILKSMLARIALVMGNLSAAGVNLLESIEIAKSVSTNVVVTEALENVKKGVFFWRHSYKIIFKRTYFSSNF